MCDLTGKVCSALDNLELNTNEYLEIQITKMTVHVNIILMHLLC